MKRHLGNLERQVFAWTQLRNIRELRAGDLVAALGITPKQERELYSRLARARMIAQVRRGLYLVPPHLPLGSTWTPDDALALNTLMRDVAIRDYFDVDHAIHAGKLDPLDPAFLDLLRRKIAAPRTGAVDVSDGRVADLRRQSDAQLLPVLRERDFAQFDLEQHISTPPWAPSWRRRDRSSL